MRSTKKRLGHDGSCPSRPWNGDVAAPGSTHHYDGSMHRDASFKDGETSAVRGPILKHRDGTLSMNMERTTVMVLLMSAKLSVFLYFVIQILIRVASEHRARLGSSSTLATDEQRQELNHEEVVIEEAVTNLDSDGPRSNFPLGLLRVRLLAC